MDIINKLDLKSYVSNAVTDVFEAMLDMDVAFVDDAPESSSDGMQIVGTVSFAGKAMGSINLRFNEDFARQITAAMLDMEDDEIEGDEEIQDVVGELSNMIGGDLKSRLCDEDLTCDLSIPTITSGREFQIEPKGWTRHEHFVFNYQTQSGQVDVYLKSVN